MPETQLTRTLGDREGLFHRPRRARDHRLLIVVLCGIALSACDQVYFNSDRFEPQLGKYAALESVPKITEPPSLHGRTLLLLRQEYGGPEPDKMYLGEFRLDLRNYDLPGNLVPRTPEEMQTVILITERHAPGSFASYKDATGATTGYVADSLFDFDVVDVSRSVRFETRSIRCDAPAKVSNGISQPEFEKLKDETVIGFVKALPRR